MEIRSEHLISMHTHYTYTAHNLVDMGDTYEMDKSICLMDARKASYLGGDKIKLREMQNVCVISCVRTYIYIWSLSYQTTSSFVIQNSSFASHYATQSQCEPHTLSIIQ